MKQFILNSQPDKDNTVRLDGNDYRYLVRVRRLAVGECFPALLPNGEQTLIQITSIEKNILTGKISEDITQSCLRSNIKSKGAKDAKGNLREEEDKKENLLPSISSSSRPLRALRLCENSSPNLPPIILFQALPKSDKMDLIVRQAAEGGITEIVPFISEFSVAKTDSGGQKFIRWERIIKEARQQSGSKIATSIRKPLSKNEMFDYWKKLQEAKAPLGLLFHHEGLEQNSLHSYLNSDPSAVVLAIGPEGGFSNSETALFLENGFKPLTIGDTILRTETAALYCSAAVRVLLLERNSWQPKKQ